MACVCTKAFFSSNLTSDTKYYEYLAQQGALAASDFGMFGNEKTVATRSRPEAPDADQGALTGLPMSSRGEAHCCDPGRQMAAMKEEAKAVTSSMLRETRCGKLSKGSPRL